MAENVRKVNEDIKFESRQLHLSYRTPERMIGFFLSLLYHRKRDNCMLYSVFSKLLSKENKN